MPHLEVWCCGTVPPECVGRAAYPLVSHDLPASDDGAPAVEHGQVAGPVPADVLPQEGRPGAGPGPDTQPGEDSEAASPDSGEVEHQGGQAASCQVTGHRQEHGVLVLTQLVLQHERGIGFWKLIVSSPPFDS